MKPNAATIAATFTTRRAAIAAVRSEADYLIEQAERRARGMDRGMYRDDDTTRTETIRERIAFGSAVAFALSAAFAAEPVATVAERIAADTAARDSRRDALMAMPVAERIAADNAAREFAAKPAAEPRTIDCTPEWSGLLPVLLALLENGNAEGARTARAELARMAKAADKWNAYGAPLVHEIVRGDGSGESLQRSIDIARAAAGV